MRGLITLDVRSAVYLSKTSRDFARRDSFKLPPLAREKSKKKKNASNGQMGRVASNIPAWLHAVAY